MKKAEQIEPRFADECVALVARIAHSNSFARSERLSAFLKYACAKTLEGRTGDLTEYQIGLNVFARSPGYNPGEDSIVRSHARLLRQRLETYFQEEGRSEPIVATIPKGSYALHFEPRKVDVPSAPAAVSSIPKTGDKSVWRWPVALGGGLVLIAAILLTWQGIRRAQMKTLVESLWSRIFASGVRTIIVPADSTLALLEDLGKQVVPLSDYLDRSYRNRIEPAGMDAKLWNNVAGRRYTSVTDLMICTRLLRLPRWQSRDVVIRYARDLQMADFKGADMVLLGGVRANPWQEMFQDKMNFRIGYDAGTEENRVVNSQPLAGELAAYNERHDHSYHRAYGIIDVIPGLNSSTSILIVQGTSAAGTEAAADFLFDNQLLEAALKRISGGASKLPHFEMLLQADTVGGSAQRPQIVATRVIPEPAP